MIGKNSLNLVLKVVLKTSKLKSLETKYSFRNILETIGKHLPKLQNCATKN